MWHLALVLSISMHQPASVSVALMPGYFHLTPCPTNQEVCHAKRSSRFRVRQVYWV